MAADKLKGITIEINGNVQPLTAAIKEATKASTGLNSELNSINRLLKNVDPGNIDLLKQKQTVLNTTIDDTKKKLKLLETAFAQATPEEVGEAQYRELERQIISTKDKLSSYESQLPVCVYGKGYIRKNILPASVVIKCKVLYLNL